MEHSPNYLSPKCPSRRVFELLADKWVLLAIAAISRGIQRNGALMRELSPISQKMLTQTLRTLQSNGLVTRHVFDRNPPHVEYRLTPLAESLIPVVGVMGRWAEQNFAEVDRLRAAAEDEVHGATRA